MCFFLSHCDAFLINNRKKKIILELCWKLLIDTLQYILRLLLLFLFLFDFEFNYVFLRFFYVFVVVRWFVFAVYLFRYIDLYFFIHVLVLHGQTGNYLFIHIQTNFAGIRWDSVTVPNDCIQSVFFLCVVSFLLLLLFLKCLKSTISSKCHAKKCMMPVLIVVWCCYCFDLLL